MGGTLCAPFEVSFDGLAVDSQLTRDASLAPPLLMQATDCFL